MKRQPPRASRTDGRGKANGPRTHKPLSPQELRAIQDRLGIHFRNPRLLDTAFIHRSYLNEHRGTPDLVSNERMEFLGDAAVEIAVTQYLYRQYPSQPEGWLTDVRGVTVSWRTLALVAEELHLVQWVRFSRGMEEGLDDPGVRESVLCDVFEAVAGAIYLDRGLEGVECFLGETLFPRIPLIVAHELARDAKSELQRRTQAERGLTPRYSKLDEYGVDHDRVFVVAVYIGDRKVGQGEGRTIKEAQVMAAQDGLLHEFGITLGDLEKVLKARK